MPNDKIQTAKFFVNKIAIKLISKTYPPPPNFFLCTTKLTANGLGYINTELK